MSVNMADNFCLQYISILATFNKTRCQIVSVVLLNLKHLVCTSSEQTQRLMQFYFQNKGCTLGDALVYTHRFHPIGHLHHIHRPTLLYSNYIGVISSLRVCASYLSQHAYRGRFFQPITSFCTLPSFFSPKTLVLSHFSLPLFVHRS